MLLLNNSQLTSLPFQRLIVSTYVHPPILADLQRQDLHQLRPRRKHPPSPRPPPENHLPPRLPPPPSPCRVARLGSQTPLRFVRPSRPPRHSRAGQRVAGSPRQKCSPPLHLRCLPTRLTRLPPTPTCWPFMSIKCAPKNRATPAPSTPVISFGNVWAWTQSSPKPASVSASGPSPAP